MIAKKGTQLDDDLAEWAIVWLFEHGLYSPLRHTLFAADRGGLPVALLNVVLTGAVVLALQR